MSEMSFPERWKAVRLGDLVKLKSGLSRPKDMEDKPNPNLTVPVYGGNGILGYTSKGSSKHRLLVIGRVGAYCGCVHIAEVPNWITDNALYSEQWFNNEVSLDFLAEQLKYFNLNQLKRRGGQPLITQSIIHELKIPLPPLPEQRAIAHVLQTIQEAKATRQRELALERERKAALMDYLFSYGTKGEPRKQTEVGEIPESWEVIQLEQVLENTQYGLSAKANLKKQGYPLLRMNNLVDGLVNTSDLKHIQLDKEELEKFRLNKGDVLFNRTNSFDLVGKTGLFDKEGDYVFASYLIRLATDARRLNSYFLSFYFNWKAIQVELKRLSFRGAGQSNISASKLKMFEIRLPSLLEQQQIADVLCAFDTKIATLEQEAERLDELFHAMLNELMTG